LTGSSEGVGDGARTVVTALFSTGRSAAESTSGQASTGAIASFAGTASEGEVGSVEAVEMEAASESKEASSLGTRVDVDDRDDERV
jgi:molybdopterin synthase catalytic subunit